MRGGLFCIAAKASTSTPLKAGLPKALSRLPGKKSEVKGWLASIPAMATAKWSVPRLLIEFLDNMRFAELSR
jgi:hypothetical protein